MAKSVKVELYNLINEILQTFINVFLLYFEEDNIKMIEALKLVFDPNKLFFKLNNQFYKESDVN